mmetsp:Transcript_25937/g.45726  ORF Transcript_25937/g.45726 Transcript_25937/m.45726 type:complete len:556 (-) Transcript_25937:199-1866(-)
MTNTSFEELNYFTQWQQITITVAPAVTGSLSLLGCWLILRLICSDWKTKSRKVQFRFLLGRTVADTIGSLMWIFWSLPIPEGTPNVWGAKGTMSTCQLQGFLMQTTVASAIYNGALSHFFYYSIVKGMSDETYIKSKRWDFSWHILASSYAIASATIGLAMNAYNPGSFGCWFFPSPLGCWQGPRIGDQETCEGGHRSYLYGWVLMGIPVLVILGFVSYFMIQIHRKVQSVMNRAVKSQMRRSSQVFATAPVTSITTGTGVAVSPTGRLNCRGDGDNDGDDDARMTSDLFEDITSRIDGALEDPEEMKQTTSDEECSNHDEGNGESSSSDNTTKNNFHSAAPLPSSRKLGHKRTSSSLFEGQMDSTMDVTAASERNHNVQQQQYEQQLQSLTYRRIQERRKESAIQAYCYISVYLLTRGFSFIVYIIDMIPGVQQPFATLLLEQTLKPLVGFLNFLVYIRPRVCALRRAYPGGFTYWQALHSAVFHYEEYMSNQTNFRATSAGSDLQLSRASRVVLEQSAVQERPAALKAKVVETKEDDDDSPSSSTRESTAGGE